MNTKDPQSAALVDAIVSRPRIHVWCDASVDVESRLAFGAFMWRGLKRPRVVKLKNKRHSMDAEIETMTKAVLAAPQPCVVMTDLQDLRQVLADWNYHTVSRFREVLQNCGAYFRYIDPELRSAMYHQCHRAAIGRLRLERVDRCD